MYDLCINIGAIILIGRLTYILGLIKATRLKNGDIPVQVKMVEETDLFSA